MSQITPNKPSQAKEDGLLVFKVLVNAHGLNLDRYRNCTDLQKEYLDDFVGTLIRELCSLLESYTNSK